MICIAVCNQKGGVGKTTTTQALYEGMRNKGMEVVAIDLDAQANLSTLLAHESNQASSYDLLTGAWSGKEHINLFKADDNLVRLARMVSSNQVSLEDLSEQIELKLGYADVVLIDTAPAKDVLHILAAAAADYILIPTTPDRLGVDGVVQELKLVNDVAENSTPKSIGVLVTRYDGQTRHDKAIATQLEMSLSSRGLHMFPQKIPSSVAIRERQASQQSLFIDGEIKRRAISLYSWLVDDVIKWIS